MLLVITSTGDRLFRFINIDDLEWLWTLKILILSDFLAIFGCKRVNCDEMDGDRLRLPANRNCYRLSRVSWALLKLLVNIFVSFKTDSSTSSSSVVYWGMFCTYQSFDMFFRCVINLFFFVIFLLHCYWGYVKCCFFLSVVIRYVLWFVQGDSIKYFLDSVERIGQMVCAIL